MYLIINKTCDGIGYLDNNLMKKQRKMGKYYMN